MQTAQIGIALKNSSLCVCVCVCVCVCARVRVCMPACTWWGVCEVG
jgi:hypothetical protein